MQFIENCVLLSMFVELTYLTVPDPMPAHTMPFPCMTYQNLTHLLTYISLGTLFIFAHVHLFLGIWLKYLNLLTII